MSTYSDFTKKFYNQLVWFLMETSIYGFSEPKISDTYISKVLTNKTKMFKRNNVLY